MKNDLTDEEWDVIRHALANIIPVYEEDAKLMDGGNPYLHTAGWRLASQYRKQAVEAKAVLEKIGGKG